MSIIEQVKQSLSDKIISIEENNNLFKKRFYIEVKKEDVVELTKIMFKDLKFRFITATATELEKYFEIVYHYSYDKTGEVVSLRVKLEDKSNPSIDSITPIFIAAEWIEREMWELIGINFVGHPNLKHLLLADDWPEKNYPLRNK